MQESTRHRTAFNVYFELGPNRSIERLREELLREGTRYGFRQVPSLRTLYRWSKDFRWQLRLAGLEEEAREKDAEAHAKRVEEMRERHGKIGLALEQKGLDAIQGYLNGALTPHAAILALKEGVRLEREAHGDAPLRRDRGNPYRAYIRGLPDDELGDLTVTAQRALEGTRFSQP
jgi:hypothetical protein